MEEIKINGILIKYSYNIYDVNITSSGSIKPIMKNNTPVKKFSKPETENKSKIYIIKLLDNSIVYFGQTGQSITTRLRQGLNPDDSTGYHGYKWKNNEKVKIHCITIETYDEKLCDDNKIEAIEAELVYNCRCFTDMWPLSQNEIHFHNDQNIKEFAVKLYEIIK